MNENKKQAVLREETFQAMCDAIRSYKELVRSELLRIGTELPVDNDYDEEEEPLYINLVDDNGTGVDVYAIDKARCNGDYVQFHLVEYCYQDTDRWIDSYLLGSSETYVMSNIRFPKD